MARSTTRRRWPATCATCAGSIAGSAASTLSADARSTRLAAHRAELTLLDVGTGGADIPLALLERASGAWPASRSSASTAAPRSSPAAAIADAGARGHRSASSSTSATAARSPTPTGRSTSPTARSSSITAPRTRRSRCCARWPASRGSGVVVNDLDRSRLGWIGAWLIGHLLTRNRYTRHDAPLSVRRAYRADEMAAHAAAAGLTPVRTIRGSFGQRYAIAACRDAQAQAGCRTAAGSGRAPGSDRRAGRRRDRRRRSGRRGPRAPGSRAPASRSSVLERSPAWRWRAGGVFASPAAVARAAPRRAGRGDARGRRTADPGDARRDRRPGRRSG